MAAGKRKYLSLNILGTGCTCGKQNNNKKCNGCYSVHSSHAYSVSFSETDVTLSVITKSKMAAGITKFPSPLPGLGFAQ